MGEVVAVERLGYMANFSVGIIFQSRSTPSADAVQRHNAAAMPAK